MPELFATPIHATTRTCAVFGHPIRHSASPAMQNAGLAALGLNRRYLAFEVHPDRLREAIAGAAAMHFIGLNQGAKALELWTGRAAPIDVMREALRRNGYG